MLTKETSDARLKIALEEMQTIPSFLKAINHKNQTRDAVHRLRNENSKTGPVDVRWNVPWVPLANGVLGVMRVNRLWAPAMARSG